MVEQRFNSLLSRLETIVTQMEQKQGGVSAAGLDKLEGFVSKLEGINSGSAQASVAAAPSN